MDVRNYRGQYGEEAPIVATAPGVVAAFADMTGEGAAGVATDRVLLVTGVRASAAGAFSFAVRAFDGTTAVAVYPRSGDVARIGDGVRYLIDTDIQVRVETGFRLQWISADGAVAKEVALQVHRLQRAAGT